MAVDSTYPYLEAGMNNPMKHPLVLAAGAFLAAWAATNFELDYRAVLWAVVSGVFGYAKPYKK